MSRSHGSSFRCLIYDADLYRAANCNGNEDSTGQRDAERQEDEAEDGERPRSFTVQQDNKFYHELVVAAVYIYFYA